MNRSLVIAAALIGIAATAWAAELRISQKGRAFDKREMSVAVGDTVQFSNDDEFIHQIYVDSPAFKFDSAESEPGNTIPLKFTTPGDYVVHCHIHPKMALTVHVN